MKKENEKTIGLENKSSSGFVTSEQLVPKMTATKITLPCRKYISVSTLLLSPVLVMVVDTNLVL